VTHPSSALTLEEFSWLIAWITTLFGSTLLTVTVLRSQPRGQVLRESSLWPSIVATLPGTALLIEFVARLAHAGWTAGREVEIARLTMLLPSVVAVFLGPGLLSAGFILPSSRKAPELHLVRVSHVGAWAASAAATMVGVTG
jgi:hypothetical protein